MRLITLAAFLVFASFAGLIDRIEVIVGRQVITELQLEEELRVTAFLNETPSNNGDAQRRAAAERLIEQALIAREMRLTEYSADLGQEADKLFQKVEAMYGGDRSFREALKRYALTEDILRRHLMGQITVLNFVGSRFRNEPGREGTDAELNRWIDDARRQVRIVYVDKSLAQNAP